jgi:hypothetical protein
VIAASSSFGSPREPGLRVAAARGTPSAVSGSVIGSSLLK